MHGLQGRAVTPAALWRLCFGFSRDVNVMGDIIGMFFRL